MSRGVEARGSEHFCLRTLRKLECAPDPGVPRALGTFRERRSVSEYGVPGAAQRIGAAERWLFENLSVRYASVHPIPLVPAKAGTQRLRQQSKNWVPDARA
jgi:hypothetical protein